LGLYLTNTKYRGATNESYITATRDLKVLTKLGLLEAKNQGRARQYAAGEELRKARAETRIRKPMADPYEEVARTI
jgi:DNA-binding transcriptional ArsR family regulator